MKKTTDEEKVAAWMDALEHPLKPEIEALRDIIKSADPKVCERIKWNAPSYYYKEDFVTFHPREQKKVHLVFHHPSIASIPSSLLEGDYKDRRMAYFFSMEDIRSKAAELQRIVQKLIGIMDAI